MLRPSVFQRAICKCVQLKELKTWRDYLTQPAIQSAQHHELMMLSPRRALACARRLAAKALSAGALHRA
jgi:hypothetical protein